MKPSYLCGSDNITLSYLLCKYTRIPLISLGFRTFTERERERDTKRNRRPVFSVIKHSPLKNWCQHFSSEVLIYLACLPFNKPLIQLLMTIQHFQNVIWANYFFLFRIRKIKIKPDQFIQNYKKKNLKGFNSVITCYNSALSLNDNTDTNQVMSKRKTECNKKGQIKICRNVKIYYHILTGIFLNYIGILKDAFQNVINALKA